MTRASALPLLMLLLAERDYEAGLIKLIIEACVQSDVDENALMEKLDDLKSKRDAEIADAEGRISRAFRGAVHA